MRQIKIYRHFFTNADCYKSAVVQDVKGVQVHSTGANNPYLQRYVGPDDGRLGENKYKNHHNRAGLDVCANAYIGKLADGTTAIYQALPWNYRCWLSGSATNGNANRLGFAGFEICEDNLKDKNYFDDVVMNLSVNLVAYLCLKYGLTINEVFDHKELHDKGLASNHGDITHWLKKYNLTMNDYRAAVLQAMQEGVTVAYQENDKEWTETYPLEEVVLEPVEEDTPVAEENIPAVKESTHWMEVVYASKTRVNLRESPSLQAKILYSVPHLNQIEVFNDYVDEKWAKVRYESFIGYMMKQFLQPHKEISQETLQQIRTYLKEALQLVEELLA